jgi:hypothetical protein
MTNSPEGEKSLVCDGGEIVGEIPETPAEKNGLVRRVGEATGLVDNTGNVKNVDLPTDTTPSQKGKIVLPLRKATFLNPENWKKPIDFAIVWLLTWVERIIKMYPKKTIFEGQKI